MAVPAYVVHDIAAKTLGIQVGGARPKGIIRVEVKGMTEVDARLLAIGTIIGTWPCCWPDLINLAHGKLAWTGEMPDEIVGALTFLREDYVPGKRVGRHSWDVYSRRAGSDIVRRVKEYRTFLTDNSTTGE